MKIAKIVALAAFAAATTTCAFAGTTPLCITYSGYDKYPDGSNVPTEWYALCWTKQSTFAGLKMDCTPVNSADKVVETTKDAPFQVKADGSCLHYLVFNIDWDTSLGGKFVVVRLDTRGASGEAANTPVNLLQAITVAGTRSASATATTSKVADPTWSDSVIDESCGLKLPIITGFDPLDGDQVEIKVANMMPNVKYNVKMGENVDALNEYGLTTPKWPDGAGEATITVPAKNAKFFRVTRDTVNK